MFDLKKFTAPSPQASEMPWGGGWTPQADLGAKGWRYRQVPKGFSCPVSPAYMIGQAGQRGCASLIMSTHGDKYNVTLHPDTPMEANWRISYGKGFTVEAIPGFGLAIISAIEEMRSHLTAE
jgi:hypothetical protein